MPACRRSFITAALMVSNGLIASASSTALVFSAASANALQQHISKQVNSKSSLRIILPPLEADGKNLHKRLI